MAVVDAIRSVFTYASFIVIPWVIYVLCFRLVFHPLRRYPGPFLAKITDGYAGIHVMGKYPHLNTYKNLRKYGGVYREAPNRLVYDTLTAMQDIYYHPRITKGHAYRQSRWLEKPSMFDTPDNAEHRRRRKIIGQALSDRTLRGFEPTMRAEINIFLRLLLSANRKSEIINMTVASRRLAVDVVGHLSFGYKWKTQTEATNRFIPDAVDRSVALSFIFYTWPLLKYISPLIRWISRKKIAALRHAIGNMIHTRMSQDIDAQVDFYSVASKSLSPEDLWDDARVFVLAGGTTISSAISGLFFNLTRHPDIYAKVAAEIRSAFSSGKDIRNGPVLNGLTYLRAVIDESLRLFPPSISPIFREPEASYTEPFVVEGQVIPPGTEVAIHLYSLLHNPAYFPEPFEFRPERWLLPPEDAPDYAEKTAQLATMRRAQVTFGMGDRSCAGKSMAYLETSLTIAKTLWYFDFETAPGEAGKLGAGTGPKGGKEPWAGVDQFQLQDIFVAVHDGPNIVFKTRGEYWRDLEGDDTTE